VQAGQIEEVARYCESDVLNTYRIWLVYELFRGSITAEQLSWSEGQIREFVANRKTANSGSGNLCQKPDRRKGIVGPDFPEDARNSIERPSLPPKLQAVSDKRENECRVTQNRWKDFPIFQRT
jgi:hypothetical protein